MTLRHLKIFTEVCRTGSITRAAENLYMAQPALSVAIAELEKNYGIQLFERINKRLVITEIGRRMYDEASLVLNAFSAFEEHAKRESSHEKLRLGSSLTVGKYMIPRIAADITHAFPDVQISIKIHQTRLIEEMVLRGELDFALIESGASGEALTEIPFYEDRLVAVCAKDYPAADELSAKELAGHRFFLREKGSAARDYFDQYCAREKIRIEPAVESVSTQAIIQCLTGLGGISILSYHLVKDFLNDGTLRQIHIENADFTRTYNVIMRNNKRLTAAQKQILQLCLKSAELFK